MKSNRCALEDEILRAVASSGISETARQHMEECELCRYTVQAESWMHALSDSELLPTSLPDPTMIWLRSQLVEQDGALFHLRQSLTLLHTAGFGLVALAWTMLISWKWEALRLFINELHTAGAVVAALNAQLLSLPLIVTLTLLTCATVAVTLHPALAE